MGIYPKQTAKGYSEIRNSITRTDGAVFAVLDDIGIEGKDILDFGCGDGTYAFRFVELGASSVVGIDISPAMIALAEKHMRTSRVRFEVAEGSKLPLSANAFDIVFTNFVLQYFPDTREPTREVYRVLRPGGHFIGVYPATNLKTGFESLYNSELPVVLDKKVRVTSLIKNSEEIRRDMIATGFKILIYKEIGDPDAVISDDYPHQSKIKSYQAILFDVLKP